MVGLPVLGECPSTVQCEVVQWKLLYEIVQCMPVIFNLPPELVRVHVQCSCRTTLRRSRLDHQSLLMIHSPLPPASVLARPVGITLLDWKPRHTREDLVNIFKLFIPQLLRYPNPTDPLNGEAAALLLRDPDAYGRRIRECVRLHASGPVRLDGSSAVPESSDSATDESAEDKAQEAHERTAASNEAGGSGSSGSTGGTRGATSGNGDRRGEGDKVGDDMRRESSAETNDGAGSSSASSSADFLMEVDVEGSAGEEGRGSRTRV